VGVSEGSAGVLWERGARGERKEKGSAKVWVQLNLPAPRGKAKTIDCFFLIKTKSLHDFLMNPLRFC
jgi:hypothetical protein